MRAHDRLGGVRGGSRAGRERDPSPGACADGGARGVSQADGPRMEIGGTPARRGGRAGAPGLRPRPRLHARRHCRRTVAGGGGARWEACVLAVATSQARARACRLGGPPRTPIFASDRWSVDGHLGSAAGTLAPAGDERKFESIPSRCRRAPRRKKLDWLPLPLPLPRFLGFVFPSPARPPRPLCPVFTFDQSPFDSISPDSRALPLLPNPLVCRL